MAFTITSRCVDVLHRACARVCPVTCIHHEAGADRMLYVDPHECIDCRACALECPAGAILSPDEVTDADRVWADVNALWFKDRAAARARVDALRPPSR